MKQSILHYIENGVVIEKITVEDFLWEWWEIHDKDFKWLMAEIKQAAERSLYVWIGVWGWVLLYADLWREYGIWERIRVVEIIDNLKNDKQNTH